jgi:hypothetical protein
MKKIRTTLVAVSALTAVLGAGTAALADAITGDLFYTRFSGAPNVKKVTFSYDGASTFTLGTPVAIGTTPGADGIAGNPKNADLLIVGGQGADISTISKSTGAVTTVGSPVSVFHLEVPTSNVVLGSGIPGALARHSIGAGGALSGGTLIGLAGTDTTVTQVITTPSGFFYTTSGSGGFGNFGTLTFNTGNPETATGATTSRLYGAGGSVSGLTLPAAHGGVYDPFTGSIILFGDDHITQLSLTGTILSDIDFVAAGQSFISLDQGTVDGQGHAYAASNSGHLVFIDYAASGLVGTGFRSVNFLDSNLDDVAPLVGSGSTSDIAEPGTLALLGIGVMGLGALRRRRAG